MNRFRALIVLPIATLFATGLIACGGDEGGDEDPTEVLKQTFTGSKEIKSGVFDLSFDVSAEGDQGGSLEAGLKGPFQSKGEGALPAFDLDADFKVDSSQGDFNATAGATSTGDKAFINFQDTEYEVPANTLQQVKGLYENAAKQQSQQSKPDTAEALGFNPTELLTDLKNEGNEDVEGTETIHISGDADIDKLAEGLTNLSDEASSLGTGNTEPPSAEQLKQVTDAIKTAEIDIYTGADDDILRKLEATLEVEPPAGSGDGVDSAKIEVTFTLSELGEPQEIAAPSGARPLAELLKQYGLDEGSLGGALGGAAGGAGGGGGAAAPSPAGGGSGGASGNTSAYYDCLAKAKGSDELQACNALIE